MPTDHLTTSHCTSFREDITLNTHSAELQEANSSSWSTPVKIYSTVMINLYPAQRGLSLLISFFIDISYILLKVLIFSHHSSRFVYHIHPFLSFFLPHCYPGFSWFHSPGENTHLASNNYRFSLIDYQIPNFILPYLISQILFRKKVMFSIFIVNHHSQALIPISHVSTSASTAFSVFHSFSCFFSFFPYYHQICSFLFLSHTDACTYIPN